MMKLISAILAASLLALSGTLAAEGESGNPATLSANTPPSITTQPLAAQILNAGSAASLSVSASGTALTYQWYQGTKGNTSNPVGGNSSSFTTPSLATNSSYWVRVSNADGSVDSAESVVVVWTQGIRIGDQFSANLSPLASGGKTLKLVGKLPVGLSLNTKTWQISGIVSGNAGNFTPSIQVIQNKAVLQTISIPISVGNFPTSLLGNYEALLKGQNGAPFGVFKLTTGKNVWTASLETLGQAKRTAKGSFVLQQGAESVSIEVKFAATKTAPAIALNFTLDGGSPTFLGTYGAGTIEGFKMIDSLATATKPILYNLIMDQGTVDALDKPAGKGWASGSFARTGIGTFKGMLGDATACSFPLRLSVTGQAILWAQPYANKNSYIGGVVDLVDLVPNANNYEALEPRVSWVKVADAKTLSYPGGFSFEHINVSGSRWLVPATHKALGESLGWLGGEKCTVRIYGAGLSNESQSGTVKLPTEFTLDKAFKLVAPVNASTVKWSGSVLKGTGGFSGSFTLPAGLAANTIAGAGAASGLLLQDDKWGVTTGLGLIKVPISGAKGRFRTAALTLEQYEVNTAPAIASVADQITTIGNSTTAIPFTVNDIHTTASSLTLSASSSNTTLVPNANIVFGGSGANRTITVTPASGQIGTTTITVSVSDGWLSSSQTFVLTVNNAPTISDIAAQTINQGSSTSALAFTVGDAQTAAGSLNVSASSSNTTLVPNANIVFGGSGSNRTVTVTTANGQSGTATITVTVSDGWLSTSSTFVLTVNSAPTISDITAQSINQGSSTSALAFTVGDAQTAAGSLNVSASSSNTTLVPTSNIVFGGSGANRTVTVTPASGQSGTATITVTVSDGSLSTSDTFVLAVNAPPTISEIYTREINVNEITGALEFTINDDQTAVTSLTVSGNSSNTTLVPNANIVFGGSGANRTVTVTPASGQTGSATITVTVSDGSLSGSDTFLLKINPVAAMVLIPAGPFTMGDSAGDYDGDAPTHTVALDSFYIGNFEVTKAEWDEVRTWAVSRGYTDLAVGGGKASNHPVHSISWHDMVKWCNARSVKEGLTPVYYTDYAQTIIYHYSEINLTNVHVKWSANGYRLPTEAEWEKAARGGLAGKRFPWGDTISHSQANYQASSNLIYDMSGFVNTYKLIGTSPAGDLEANGYGLYDMSGNLWEMCWDRYGSYAEGIQTNPHGVDSGSSRVRRGGSWYYFANVSRNASRSYQPPTWSDYDVGFRIARNLEANEENTYPTISDIVAQRISSVSNTGALTFSISDAQTEASTLTVSGSSSNTTLISDSNIVFGGSGANRTVTVTPTSGQTGTATITVTVSDGSLSSSDTFALTVTNDNTPDMAHIPAGQFDIGNTAGYINGISLDAYFIGKYEVTKAEWDEVRTWAVSNGYTDLAVGGGKASNHPVHSISWYDMVKWCNARSQKEGLSPVYWVSGTVMRTGATAPTATWSANGYRLPTEAEWEKAARGGLAGKRFPWGDTISHSQANYQASTSYNYDLSGSTNSYHPTYKTGNQPYTSPVGSFAANGYGLYDMSGNLWEMCWNWWGTYTGSGGDPVNNPRGPLEPLTSDKVCRGGDWFAAPVSCQVTHRGMTNPSNSSIYTGFRIARSSVP